MKKLISALFAALLLVCSTTAVNAADVPDEQWLKTGPTETGGSWGINTNDDTSMESPLAYLTSAKADNYNQDGRTISKKTCSSFAESECPRTEFQYYETPLDMCVDANDYDCIQEFLIEKSDGTKLNYSFVRTFPDANKYAFKGDKEAQLPDSGYSVIIKVPGAPHNGGDLYLANVVVTGERMPFEKTFHVSRMLTSIHAITLEPDHLEAPFPTLDTAIGNSFRTVTRGGDIRCRIQCSATENALGQAFPADIKFGLSLRLNVKVSGWLNGRVSNVESSISTDSNGYQIVKVLGYPVKVPVVFGWISKATMPSDLKDFYASMGERANSGNGFGKCLDPAKPAGYSGPCNANYWESALRSPQRNEEGLKELSLWLPIIKDTAAIAPTEWNINSTDSGFEQNCIADSSQLTGIVTTNSTSFISGPPVFNKAEGILDYKVLAPHYLKDGTVFKGTYDLTINSKFARCLYRFTNAPIQATVSIISADGQNQVATVVTGENNGWFHLGAYGFTFSNPTVRVKMTQEAPAPTPSESPSATPSPTPTAVNKTTITCTRGKATKKVSAVSPKCPAGYKKK